MKKLFVALAVTAAIGAAQAHENIDTDIAVIGAGGAGLSAAVEAANLGAHVVVLEKMPMLGGNTKFATGGLNAAETSVQAMHGIKDSIKTHFEDTMKGGHNLNDPELVKTLVENAGNSVEWLLALGGDFRDVGMMGGATNKRAHRPTGGAAVGPEVMKTLVRAAKERKDNITILANTTVTGIITDKSGAVTGLKVRDNKSKEEYVVNAPAVVDAAGGFGANQAMVVKYRPDYKGMITTNQPGAQGEGISLVEKLGAKTVDMAQIQIHPTVVPGAGSLITEAVRGNGAILINTEGKRFYNEISTRDAVSAAILKQPTQSAFLFFDSEMQKSLKATNKYIKAPYCVSGETIAELATKLEIKPEVLEATIKTYDAGRKAGKDEFGRADMPLDLTTGPFYAIRIAPAVHHTMGGVKINSKAEVIGAKGVIKGLYAAGEVTGGVHGGNRLGGNAQADIVTFGRIAGQEAAAYSAAAKKASK